MGVELIERAFICDEDDFKSWILQNSDVQRIVLKGGLYLIDTAYLGQCIFDAGIEHVRFDMQIYADERRRRYLGHDYVSFEEVRDDKDAFIMEHYDMDPIPPFLKMILNGDVCREFKICDGSVFSEDGKILIHVPQAKVITIPQGVEMLGHYAFYYYNCENIIWNNEVKRLGERCFLYCEHLKEAILPESVVALGDCCFEGCDELSKVVLPPRIQEIPLCCFCYDLQLNSIQIPASVKRICCAAFQGTFNSNIHIPEGVETIECVAFDCGLRTIYLPSTLTHIDPDFYCEAPINDDIVPIPHISVSNSNPIYYSKGGRLYLRENDQRVI